MASSIVVCLIIELRVKETMHFTCIGDSFGFYIWVDIASLRVGAQGRTSPPFRTFSVAQQAVLVKQSSFPAQNDLVFDPMIDWFPPLRTWLDVLRVVLHAMRQFHGAVQRYHYYYYYY